VIVAKLLLSIYRKRFQSPEGIFFSDKDNDVYQPLADIFIEITGGSRFVSSRLRMYVCELYFFMLRLADTYLF